jgi:hypothetical protein
MADRFDVVAIRIEDKGRIVALMVLRAKPGTTIIPPAASASSWKASTLARSEAANAMWTGWPRSPWPIQKSGLPRRPNPAVDTLGSMISS